MHTHQGKDRDDTGGIVGSYLWNNVVKLGAKPRNYQNADNLMYFALGKHASLNFWKYRIILTISSAAAEERRQVYCSE